MAAIDRVRSRIAELPAGVQAHVEQVRLHAVGLARTHDIDVVGAELAALAHDVCRTMRSEELLEEARGFAIPVTSVDEAFPVFLHGLVGAEVVKRDFNVVDEGILDAIRYHTTGRGGMTPIEQAIFIADKLDPSKIRRYPFLPKLAAAAYRDLNEGMHFFVDRQVKAFLENGDLVHPGMLAARNDALMALKTRKTIP